MISARSLLNCCIDSSDKKLYNKDENHGYVTDKWYLTATSHMIGNVMIDYEFVLDEDVHNAFEEAYNNLVAALNLTPEY